MELVRAQFHSFSKLMPLLYLILISNAGAIMVEFYRADLLVKTLLLPLAMCALALWRALWWGRQDLDGTFSDTQMAGYIHRTCTLAVLLTLVFDGWCMWLYQTGDTTARGAYARGHLTFFLALTELSTVFCLMTMRAAAMRVGATGTLLFVVYFGIIDNGHMVVEAVVLCFVTLGMMVVTHRYNQDFSRLIRSQRELRNRHAHTEKLSEDNRRIALTDALSGLPNRRELLDRLDRLEKARLETDLLEQDRVQQTDGLAVLFIDLDGFKDINDAHGHQAGDTMIRSLSARLHAICPPCATLARVGGDEFVVLIEAVDEIVSAGAAALALARAIGEEVCQPVLVDRHILQVGASIGVASNAAGPLAAHELLRRADTAMYHVKMSGKGTVAEYDPAFDAGRLRRLEIEEEIARGLAHGEFEVAYQPIVEAQGCMIVGAEALVRWPRRPGGALPPDQFIGIAEATGQILPLGLFVLERACRDVLPLGNLRLSVNVSPAQFRDPGFERQVAHVLEQTRFPPARLQFEITEGYLLAHAERAARAIDAFKAMGMTIALDDFGTGFTSIHYLQSYGFTHIKLDKSLLVGLLPGNKASLLVTGAINLASGLDMRVIAEGVETEEQAAILRSAGCHKLQGYLFGRPMPIGQLAIARSRIGAAGPGPLRKTG